MVAFCSTSMRRLIALMLVVSAVLIWPGIAKAAAVEVTLHRISADGVGESIGTVSARDSDQGLEIIPSLSGLTPGEHGFHLHANSSCDSAANADGAMVAGLAAGGHWDPDETGEHLGPFGNGHRGDLSRLVVNDDGTTPTSVVAPRLSTADLRGKALVVHAGGDTYSDTPALGGGGARIACGVVGR